MVPRPRSTGDMKMKFDQFKIAALIAASIWTQAASATAEMNASVTSPAFDAKIYKADAVKNTTKTFANWSLICADVRDLSRRFCNLSSIAKSPGDNFFVAIVVSTTDEGKPAALVRVPLSISLREGVDVSSVSSGKKAKPSFAGARHVDFATCENQICTSVVLLKPTDLATLSARGGLHLRLHVLTDESPILTASLMPKSRGLDVVFDGTGFAEALQASQAQEKTE